MAICLDGSPYANGGQVNSQGIGQNQQQDRGNFSRFGQPTPPPMEQTSFSDYANQPQGNPSGVMHGPNEKDEDIPF